MSKPKLLKIFDDNTEDVAYSKLNNPVPVTRLDTSIISSVNLSLEGNPTISFKAPCDCTEVTDFKIYDPNSGEYGDYKNFKFVDAHGNDLSSISELFKKDSMVKIIIDTASMKAYIQNADTNAYLEKKFKDTSDKIPENIKDGEGTGSLVGGKDCTAKGDQAIAAGLDLKASSKSQAVFGEYNIEDILANFLLIVGNGTASADSQRSNAMTVDRSGNLKVAGNITDGNGNVLDSFAKFASGSYVGTGVHGENNPTIIPVPFKPNILVIEVAFDSSPSIYNESWFGQEYSDTNGLHIKYDNSQIYMYYFGGGDSGNAAQHNAEGKTYYWYVF